MINTPYQSRGFAKFKISRSEAPTGHHPVEGVQRGHDPGPEKPAGERHIQENSGESSICKGSFPQVLGKTHFQAFEFKSLVNCTNLQDIAREKSAGLIAGISASSTFQVLRVAIALLLIGSIRSQILRWTLNEGNIFYSTFVIISATL